MRTAEKKCLIDDLVSSLASITLLVVGVAIAGLIFFFVGTGGMEISGAEIGIERIIGTIVVSVIIIGTSFIVKRLNKTTKQNKKESEGK